MVEGQQPTLTVVDNDEAIDLDTLAAPYRFWAKQLTDLKSQFTRLAARADIGGHMALKIVRLQTSVEELRGMIMQAEPMRVCVKCDGEGEGCQFCCRTGFQTRSDIEFEKGRA